MENRKGNGIFLGIVSVATLIVAIIGATFAFFSATTQSDPNAVNLQAYEFKLNLSVSQVWEFASGLIPMNPTGAVLDENNEQIEGDNNTNLLYALNEAQKRCVDSNNLQVCALYAVTITNNAANTVKLSGQIKTTANNPGSGENATPFKSLYYQALDGTPDAGFTLDGAATQFADVNGDIAVDSVISIEGIEVPGATTVDGETTPGSATSYVLIYLNDTGLDQSLEMGASYEGQLIYTSEGGDGNTLTGTFRVSGTTEEPNA